MKQLSGLFIGVVATAQLSYGQINNNWPIGMASENGAPVSSGVISFNSNPPVFEARDLHMNFESTVASVSDSTGQLWFYTNGCFIANKDGEPILNSEGLNPGPVHDWVCSEVGYICPRGAMFIRQPDNPNIFYLFHLGMRYDFDKHLTYGPLYYSVLDMNLNNGQGAVISKNNILIDGDLEPFTAVRHGNGRDWWIIIPTYHSNTYHRFCLTPSGVKTKAPVVFGTAGYCEKTGISTFSPDGSRYARTQNCLTLVFDFDRCNGTFSNEIRFERAIYLFGGGGAAFNASANTLFLSEQLVIFKANLESPVPTLDTLIQFESVMGTSLQHMQYGPDGNLYFNLTQRGRYLPYLSGVESTPQFHRKEFIFPVKNVRSLPNLPNYALGEWEGSTCDSLVAVQGLLPPEVAIRTWPNPVTDTWRVEINPGATESPFNSLRIYNLLGQKILEIPLTPDAQVYTIDFAPYPSGMYVWAATQINGILITGLFEKID